MARWHGLLKKFEHLCFPCRIDGIILKKQMRWFHPIKECLNRLVRKKVDYQLNFVPAIASIQLLCAIKLNSYKLYRMNFDSLFSDKNSDKSNYLARILGIFSENIVSFWSANENCCYESLGRPTIYDKTGNKLASLDFTLKHKKTGRYFIVEQKNLVAYKNGNLLHMCDDESFHKAFESFSIGKSKLTLAWKLFLGPLTDCTVKVKKEKLPDDYGRILIWSKFDIESKIKITSLSLIDKILSFEQIHKDLIDWNDTKYMRWLDNRFKWTNELFNHLKE